MDVKVILTPPCIVIPLVIPHTKFTGWVGGTRMTLTFRASAARSRWRCAAAGARCCASRSPRRAPGPRCGTRAPACAPAPRGRSYWRWWRRRWFRRPRRGGAVTAIIRQRLSSIRIIDVNRAKLGAMMAALSTCARTQSVWPMMRALAKAT